jgi:hypothetical protein
MYGVLLSVPLRRCRLPKLISRGEQAAAAREVRVRVEEIMGSIIIRTY